MSKCSQVAMTSNIYQCTSCYTVVQWIHNPFWRVHLMGSSLIHRWILVPIYHPLTMLTRQSWKYTSLQPTLTVLSAASDVFCTYCSSPPAGIGCGSPRSSDSGVTFGCQIFTAPLKHQTKTHSNLIVRKRRISTKNK